MYSYLAKAERLRASAPFIEDYEFLSEDDNAALRMLASDVRSQSVDPLDVEFTVYKLEEVGRV